MAYSIFVLPGPGSDWHNANISWYWRTVSPHLTDTIAHPASSFVKTYSLVVNPSKMAFHELLPELGTAVSQ
jgi:hypothetical protein